MSGGRKVFDGSTELALTQAPKRLVIDSEDARLKDVLTPFAATLEDRPDGALTVFLKPEAESHTILEKCVNMGVKLSRYEPKNPSLHEAFVALVGRDEVAKMKEDAT